MARNWLNTFIHSVLDSWWLLVSSSRADFYCQRCFPFCRVLCLSLLRQLSNPEPSFTPWLLCCCWQELSSFGFRLCSALRREARPAKCLQGRGNRGCSERGQVTAWAGQGSLGMSLGAHLHACMSFILCSAGAKEDLRSLSMENSLEAIYGYIEKVSMAFERRKCFNGGQDFDRWWERQQGPVDCGWSWDCDRCVYWSSADPGTSQKIQ